jgi:hypothetical protein
VTPLEPFPFIAVIPVDNDGRLFKVGDGGFPMNGQQAAGGDPDTAQEAWWRAHGLLHVPFLAFSLSRIDRDLDWHRANRPR